MGEDKFYRALAAIEDNFMGFLIGAAVLAGIGTWTHKMYSTYRDSEIQKAKVAAGLEIRAGYYNDNNTLDRFYEIDGKKVPIEVDGRPIEDFLK